MIILVNCNNKYGVMSIDEMKWKITSSLNDLSEQTLQEVFDLIKNKEEKASLRYDINSEIEFVLNEDAVLLKRLAE